MRIEYDGTEIELTPTKIIALARNYRSHAKEMGSPVPEEPTIFLKPPSALTGNNGTVILPKVSERIDYEAELAVIIKSPCKNVSVEEAATHIMGYSVCVDVTARDIQAEAKKKGLPWAVAKGYDTFAPLGPKIVAVDVIDLHNCEIWLKVNNEYKQRGNTRDMIFSVDELISYISKIMTLEPMDVIATGTPEGVGPMKDGDVIEAGIEGIGTLTFRTQKER